VHAAVELKEWSAREEALGRSMAVSLDDWVPARCSKFSR